MPKILMKQSKPGSVDGVTINLYKAGKEYEIDGDEITLALANAFVNAHWAKFVRERSVIAPPETAVIVEAPEIKEVEEVEEVEEVVELEKKEPAISPDVKTVRVYELAKELKIGWQDVIAYADKIGISANKAQSGLTDAEVEAIKKEASK